MRKKKKTLAMAWGLPILDCSRDPSESNMSRILVCHLETATIPYAVPFHLFMCLRNAASNGGFSTWRRLANLEFLKKEKLERLVWSRSWPQVLTVGVDE